jgi:type II secretory pathway component PulK
VLILVLWVLFALAALTVAVGSHVSAAMSVSERLWGITESRALAEAGANQALMAAMSRTNVWDGIAEDGWNRDEQLFSGQPLGNGLFSVEFYTISDTGVVVTNIGIIGESGKINLNSISRTKEMKKTLENLIMSVGGVEIEAAQDITAQIMSLVNEDDDELTDDGESDYYATSSSRSSYTNEPIKMESIAELRTIKGLEGELYMQLLPYVTVYGNGFINLNCASKPVLTALAEACDSGNSDREIFESLAAKVIEFQKSGNVFDEAESSAIRKKMGEFTDLSSDENRVFMQMMRAITIKSSAFRGISFGTGALDESAKVSVEFVFDTGSETFVYWHEMQ